MSCEGNSPSHVLVYFPVSPTNLVLPLFFVLCYMCLIWVACWFLQVTEMIRKVDVDGNGALDYREFVAMMSSQNRGVSKPSVVVSASRRDA